jgi:lysophospholipase L1-like esterase
MPHDAYNKQPRTELWPEYAQLIEQKYRLQVEGPLLDKKQELYIFGVKQSDDETEVAKAAKKRVDLIVDFMALANAALKRHEPAYICFGIGEHDDWGLHTIEGQHPNPPPNLTWEDAKVHPDRFNKWIETIYQQYVPLLKRFVAPTIPTPNYQTGWYDESRMLAVLEIPPLPNQNVGGLYLSEHNEGEWQRLAERAKVDHRTIRLGSTWRRIGSNNDWVSPEERLYLFPDSPDIPYIPEEGWLTYFDELMERFKYLHAQDVQQVTQYQPLGTTDSQVEALDRLREFASHTSGPAYTLILIGMPGAGKTTVVRQLAYELAKKAKDGILGTKHIPYRGDDSYPRWLDQPNPEDVVPLYLPLSRWAVSSRAEFSQRFAQAITQFAGEAAKLHEQPDQALNLLKDGELNLLVMLDGLDEVSRKDDVTWCQTIDTIREVIGRFPQAKFIVTCRSDQYARLPEWHSFSHIELKPLAVSQVEDVIGQMGWQVDIEPAVLGRLKAEVLVNPRALDALKRNAKSVFRLTLGAAVSHIMRGRLDEEYDKRLHMERKKFANQVESALARLALAMLRGNSRSLPEAMVRREIGDEFFDWAWRAGLLSETRTQICFDSDFALCYWAAQELEISPALHQELEQLVNFIRSQMSLWEWCIRIAFDGVHGWPEKQLESLLIELAMVDSGMTLRIMCDLHRWHEFETVAELSFEEYARSHDDLPPGVELLEGFPARLQIRVLDILNRPSAPLFDSLARMVSEIARPYDVRYAAVRALRRMGYADIERVETELREEEITALLLVINTPLNDRDTRLQAARRLVELGFPRAAEYVSNISEEAITKEDISALPDDQLPIPKLD